MDWYNFLSNDRKNYEHFIFGKIWKWLMQYGFLRYFTSLENFTIVTLQPGVKKYRVPKIERPSAHRTLC